MPIRDSHPGSGAHTTAYKIYIWLLSTRVRWPKRKADNFIYSTGRKTRQLIPPLHHMSLRRGSSFYYQWPCCVISCHDGRTDISDAHTTSIEKNTSRSSSTVPSRDIYLAFTPSCIACPCLYTTPCCGALYTLKGRLDRITVQSNSVIAS